MTEIFSLTPTLVPGERDKTMPGGPDTTKDGYRSTRITPELEFSVPQHFAPRDQTWQILVALATWEWPRLPTPGRHLLIAEAPHW